MDQNICIGMLAHVDAGKTTFSESVLYASGSIRRAGRVDKKDTFLDTFALERERGITIFSKQALFSLGDKRFTLLDTPGHVDFSAEMERALRMLDYGVLIISGADGVQGHTQTLWRLLKRYRIPAFLFVNKMDQEGTDKESLFRELRERLDDRCVDFSADASGGEFLENIAVCEEAAMERYLSCGDVPEEEIARLISQRKVFPCYFGSALKQWGVTEFLEGLKRYTACPKRPEAFGANVFKINRDEQGNRLTWLKVTGGSLKVKDLISGGGEKGRWEEKVNQIRVYSGEKYEARGEAKAGQICAVTGLTRACAGEGLGAAPDLPPPSLEPVLSYRIDLPAGCAPQQMFGKLKMLEEEAPELHLRWDEQLQEIQAQLMGEVQTEVLKTLIQERFGIAVDFREGRIVYKETILDPVEGVGHFEPLRHYAEAHLLLEAGDPGSGMQYLSSCSEDVLDKNWQRLILARLEEKIHRGVLTGSELTDMRITLVSGKAHPKHTEGGDFGQAACRAVRQGLMRAKSVLLEPFYEFRLEVPADALGRAMADLEKMSASFEQPQLEADMAVLKGTAPVSAMRNYQREALSYTKGRGRLFCSLQGYAPCHNTEEALEQCGYHPEADLDNPADSIFCYHGAGMVVPWHEVEAHMHMEPFLKNEQKKDCSRQGSASERQGRRRALPEGIQEEKELEEIFARTYGTKKRREPQEPARIQAFAPKAGLSVSKPREKLLEYLLVDGYNVIFAWEELSALAKVNIDSARDKLMDVLCNYQGFRKCSVILVFDAYRVQGHAEEAVRHHNIHVVYTREAETADQYIERAAHEMGKNYQVTVATSDGLEQIIIRGQGCAVMSARELKEEIDRVNQEIRETYAGLFPASKNYLFDALPEELAERLREVRLGRETLA